MRRRLAAWALLVACVAALATRASGDLDAQAAGSPLLVSLLDGTVQAVDRATGESLWSFSSGGPLVRAHARPARGEWDHAPDDETDAVALRSTRGGPAVVFPGVDGALYALSSESPNARGDETKAAVARLPVTARQLVDASPSMTRDGALVLGTRTSVVFALDAERGTLLRTFTAEGVVMHAAPGDGGDEDGDVDVFALDAAAAEDASSPELLGAVFVGRTEYKVRSVDAKTGAERWNVTYGEVHPLTAPAAGGAATLVARRAASSLDPASSAFDDVLPTLRFGSGNALTMMRDVDAKSSEQTEPRWSRTFPSVPLSAFEGSGAGGSARRGDGGGRVEKIFVGAHAGGLYALPGPTRDADSNAPPRLDVDRDEGDKSVDRDRDGLVSLLLRGSGFDGVETTEATPMAVSPRATENDWACVPEGLAAAALATRGRPFLDGALWGYAPSFLDGDAFADLKDTDGGGRERVWSAAVTVAVSAAAGLGVGAAIVVAARGRVPTEKSESVGPSEPRASGGAFGDALAAGKKKRGARGKKRGSRGTSGAGVSVSADDRSSAAETDDVAPKAEPKVEPKAPPSTRTGASDEDREEEPPVTATTTTASASASPPPEVSSPERKTKTRLPDDARPPSVRGATRVGRLEVGPGVIGYGSCGTVVFEGVLDGRPVAVKRLLAHFHELARAELQTLIASDEHPNILRCFAMEEDEDFVYVALERCSCTLASLVAPEGVFPTDAASMSPNSPTPDTKAFAFVDERTLKPTPEGLRLMRDAFAGVNALHAVGVVHRDLKPQNVLVTPRHRGKLADMGLAKKLNVTEGTSFETRPIVPPSASGPSSAAASAANGAGVGGTAGWLAPERLAGGRQSRAVDAFGLGCLLHYCLTGGGHPFGARYERDANVLRGEDPDLEDLERVSREAADLVSALIRRDPAERPTAAEALAHPLWWSDAVKLKFLCDVSDRVEMEDREAGGTLLLRELERGALPKSTSGGGVASARRGIGIGETSWSSKLPPSLVQNLGKYRSYKGDEIRDLLRVIRNKSNHFRELPKNVQNEVGAPPEGFYRYFENKFPRLLMHAYGFVKENCAHEPGFRNYFFPSEETEKGVSSFEASAAMAKSAERVAARAAARAAERAAAVAAAPPVEFPERPGAPECVFFVKTGRCKFGARCHFHHPKGLHA
jgi:serine/threonine-protein kinase/endoribonuclease IRE1